MEVAIPHVLYLTPHGLASPLGRAQCVPYLLRLSEDGRARFTVVSWEADPLPDCALRERIAAAGIRWYALPYHPGAPAKVWDALQGLAASVATVVRDRPDLVHARSYVPATIALVLGAVARVPYIFDILGLLADEYADAGHWSRAGFLYRATKWIERVLLRKAAAIITLTEANERSLRTSGLVRPEVPIPVLPCAVDPERFGCDGAPDAYPRGARPLLIYSGGIGPWYRPEAMAAFAATARRITPDLRFLVLTRGDTSALERAAREQGIPAAAMEVRSVHPDDVAAILCTADVGLSFRSQGVSMEAVSPNKFGEYLACGLPVVSSRGIGDVDEITLRERVGAIVEREDAAAYERAWRDVVALLEQDAAAARERCRKVSRTELRPERVTDGYAQLYRELLDGPSRDRSRRTVRA